MINWLRGNESWFSSVSRTFSCTVSYYIVVLVIYCTTHHKLSSLLFLLLSKIHPIFNHGPSLIAKHFTDTFETNRTFCRGKLVSRIWSIDVVAGDYIVWSWIGICFIRWNLSTHFYVAREHWMTNSWCDLVKIFNFNLCLLYCLPPCKQQ